jgi:hypothetical protein
MSKKILALYYSQTGQLKEILDSFTAPFIESGVTVEKVPIRLKKDFVFPWTTPRFFDVMPESVLGIPVELEDFNLKESKYDLIIFAYSPWFLSPSVPANSVLLHSSIKEILKNTPVITLIGARNMWLNAQEKVKAKLKDAGAKLSGNVVLFNRNNNYISAVTIFYWMLTGKTDKKWGVFPKPKISDADIEKATGYGTVALKALQKNDFTDLQENLIKAEALEVKWDLMFIETRAGKLFSIWANIIIKRKNRAFWLVLFKYYLLIALFGVAPIVVLINGIFFKPFLGNRINKKKQHYLELN